MSRIRPLACWRLASLSLLLIPLAACREELPTTQTAPEALAASNPDLPDRYMVVFQPTVPDVDALAEALTRVHGGTPGHRYYTVLKGYAATLPAAALDGIRRNPNVAYVEPDGIATPVELPYRSLAADQWGLDRVDQAADRTRDNRYYYENEGAGVEVYIVDTGIWFNHPEYAGRALSFHDYVDDDASAEDCDGHGTHVAGTVGGTTVGIARAVTLYSARVLDCNGSGWYSDIVAAIDAITEHKATHDIPMVGNMSLGGGYSAALNTAVNSSVAQGVVWAVAAGNNNRNACNYSPASAEGALTVGATTSSDARSSFSNYGTCLDLFAPGSAIYSSVMGGGFESWSGTSMATPHVAGVAALYLSAWPNASPSEVNLAITDRATKSVVTSPGTGSPNLLLYSLLTTTPSEPVIMHLAGLVGYSTVSRKTWSATATAAVHDPNHAPVSGAVVTFALSGGAKGTGNCTTGTNGQCSYTKSGLKNNLTSVTFTVTGISKTGGTYDASKNDASTSLTIPQ